MTTAPSHISPNHHPHDPPLAERLVELKERCQELGAIEVHLLPGADMAWLYYEADGAVEELRIPGSGAILIARFTDTDE